MALAGRRRHRARIETRTSTADSSNDGSFTDSWALLSPGVVSVSVEPASAGSLERFGQNVVTSSVTHVVEMPYYSGVTVNTRLTFKGRIFNVIGVQNPEERNERLVLACVEQL